MNNRDEKADYQLIGEALIAATEGLANQRVDVGTVVVALYRAGYLGAQRVFLAGDTVPGGVFVMDGGGEGWMRDKAFTTEDPLVKIPDPDQWQSLVDAEQARRREANDG